MVLHHWYCSIIYHLNIRMLHWNMFKLLWDKSREEGIYFIEWSTKCGLLEGLKVVSFRFCILCMCEVCTRLGMPDGMVFVNRFVRWYCIFNRNLNCTNLNPLFCGWVVVFLITKIKAFVCQLRVGAGGIRASSGVGNNGKAALLEARCIGCIVRSRVSLSACCRSLITNSIRM